jgi:hypothetical protein
MNANKTKIEPSYLNSINKKATNPRELSITDQMRLALLHNMLELEQSGRTLFFLTVTYRPYQNKIYGAVDVDQFFARLYVQHFLPELLKTRHYNRSKFRPLQPVTYAFIDEHKPDFVKSAFDPNLLELTSRLHHHAVLAVHPETLCSIQNLVGTNTMKTGFSSKVMTTDLKPCDAGAVGYASKKFGSYPDFLIFPDRVERK